MRSCIFGFVDLFGPVAGGLSQPSAQTSPPKASPVKCNVRRDKTDAATSNSFGTTALDKLSRVDQKRRFISGVSWVVAW